MEGDSPCGPKVDALADVRVQKVQRVQRFDTAFGREGCGGRLHGHALAGVKVQKVQRVQRFKGWWQAPFKKKGRQFL